MKHYISLCYAYVLVMDRFASLKHSFVRHVSFLRSLPSYSRSVDTKLREHTGYAEITKAIEIQCRLNKVQDILPIFVQTACTES